MAGRVHIKLLDYDGDVQSISFEGINATAGNFDAQATERAAVISAIQGITLGNTLETGFSQATQFVVSNPTDPFAQVNIQWIVEYVDNTLGGVYTTRIGTADLALADTIYNGAPALNVASGGAGNALAVALEAYGRRAGNDITVQAIYFRE